MLYLALAFWLLASPAEAERPLTVPPEAARQVFRADLCAVAEQIAAQRPCLRPEDCGAFQDWKRLFGVPRIEPLTAEFVLRRVARTAGPFRQGPRVQDVPASFFCLAAVTSEGAAFNKSLERTRPRLGKRK